MKTGLINVVFNDCLRNRKYTSQGGFIGFWERNIGMSFSGSSPVTGFINHDYIPNASPDLYDTYNKRLVDCYDIFALEISGIFKENEKNIINEKLIETVRTVTHYATKRNPDLSVDLGDNNPTEDKINPDLEELIKKSTSKNKSKQTNQNNRKDSEQNTQFEKYDLQEKRRLLTYLTIKKDYYDLTYNIFLVLTFAISKKLPENFVFGKEYKTQLKTFNDSVTCMYGVTSNAGIAQILSMSDKNSKSPNFFAIFSYADLLYYGTNYGIRKNWAECYENYKRAAGITSLNTHITGAATNDPYKSFCHPLALFSTAFLLLKYNDTKEENIEEYVSEIQAMSTLERYDNAAKFASAAFIFCNSPAAANSLGQIAAKTEEEIPGIENIKQKYQLLNADYYFEYARQKEYVYATNNLALMALKKAFDDPDSKETHLKEYLDNLKISSKKFDPWAQNRLGEFYRTGTIKLTRKKVIKIPNDTRIEEASQSYSQLIDDFTLFNSEWSSAEINIQYNKHHELILTKEEIMVFPERIDRDKAFGYYNDAIIKYNNADSAWAYAHLIIDYPEKYKDSPELKQYVIKAFSLDNKKALEYIKNKFKDSYHYELSTLV